MRQIQSADELLSAVEAYGFLPFYRNFIRGFSVEELCLPSLMHTVMDGPWKWKGDLAQSGACLYGKFFGGRAGFVSKAWIPDFVNDRRDGYDFDARCDDGLVFYRDRELFETVEEHGAILSKELKALRNYGKGGNKGFDTILTRLQMQGYLCMSALVFQRDRDGNPYGWGVAQYSTPEHIFGYDYVTSAYRCAPSESRQRMIAHLSTRLPDATSEQIARMVRGSV